jgi:hypothetical protein
MCVKRLVLRGILAWNCLGIPRATSSFSLLFSKLLFIEESLRTHQVMCCNFPAPKKSHKRYGCARSATAVVENHLVPRAVMSIRFELAKGRKNRRKSQNHTTYYHTWRSQWAGATSLVAQAILLVLLTLSRVAKLYPRIKPGR